MKKALSLLIVLTMLVGMISAMSISTSAAAWDGVAATGFAGGNGSQNDPYQIATPGQWAYFAKQCESGTNFSGKYIVLENDLTFNEGDATTWGETAPANTLIPVGLDDGANKMFAGNFDGKGHTISGVYMNGYKSDANMDGIGLFGCSNGATVKNFVLKNSYFIAEDWAGCVVGEAWVKNDGSNTTTIQNVYVCEDVTMESKQSDRNKSAATAGFVGGMYGGDVTVSFSNCVFAGTVTAITTSVGGFVGNGNYKTIVLENCMMLGSVSGSGTASGFVGLNNQKSDKSVAGTTTLTNCIYAGSEYRNFPFGTFAPYTYEDETYFTIENCYTTTAENENAYNSNGSVKPEAEDSGVTSIELLDLIGSDAIAVDGYTKRANDIMVPSGVASFAPSTTDKYSSKYTVTWKDEDGTILATEEYEIGEVPTFKGEEPTKEGDETYNYTFSGWTPSVVAVSGDAEYTAKFVKVRNIVAEEEEDETTKKAPATTTAPVTTAPTTTAPATEEGGCGSVIGGGILMLALLAGGATVVCKKKED